MKKIYFTPGPSQMYPKLERYMSDAFKNNIPSISHRSEQFMSIVKEVNLQLRKLLSIPLTHHIFFLSSSMESMERIIDNAVDQTSFHLTNGAFADQFLHSAKAKNKKAHVFRFLPGDRIPVTLVPVPPTAELICITQNETSNGSSVPMEDIYRLKKRHQKIPFAIDIVSSAPYVSIDFAKIECAFFSVQKGFGLPAGLGVLIVNDKMVKKSQKEGYHDFPSLYAKSLKHQTPETPNVLDIYLLGRVVTDMNKIGIAKIRAEIEKKAKMMEKVGQAFIKDLLTRSKTVIVLETHGKTKEIVQKLEKKGIVVGKGYGEFKDTHIRIANFPQHTMSQMKKLITELKKVI